MATVLWFVAALLGVTVSGIEVAPNSPCSDLCIDKPGLNISNPYSSSTQTWDLVCEDGELSGPQATATGIKWVNCVGCESASSANSPDTPPTGENDVYWFLFNIKFTIDWCVYGYPNNNNATPAMETCSGTCQPMILPMTDKLLETNMTLQYDYCTTYNGSFTSTVQNCIQCLEGANGTKVLANYLRAMDIACKQRPPPGTALNLGFNVFDVNYNAAATTTTSVLSSSSSSTASPTHSTAITSSTGSSSTNSSSVSSASSSSSSSSSSNSVKLGVGIGVSLGVASVSVGAFFFIRRWRQHQSQRQQQNNASMLQVPALENQWKYYQGPPAEMEASYDHKRQWSELDGSTRGRIAVSEPQELDTSPRRSLR
ncbi:hypothetical protein VTN77DRAFT_3416 [Rasamsonia byssochlamydoides]|uniref:uncharacterized protein n=1 Tax=Rasamsonia byssochlamydoides TaxID=89139 RepID=UPI003742F751